MVLRLEGLVEVAEVVVVLPALVLSLLVLLVQTVLSLLVLLVLLVQTLFPPVRSTRRLAFRQALASWPDGLPEEPLVG